MASPSKKSRHKLIVDSIHGDIHLNQIECRVIDTAPFQRLRHLKQLGMAQLTYPTATHTRFAHSIGVLGIMERITRLAKRDLTLSDKQVEDIRLAGLLHDIGHYPYSHLMERVDNVQLTEEFISQGPTVLSSTPKYPDHEDVGEWIVTHQPDLIDALSGLDRAQQIADLFTRKTASDPQLSKLIHSSLDMDRLDYLIRDARGAGVPYGNIDLNYLINNFQTSQSGMLGVREKAITAVDQFLLARFFMHRAVYYHKTTFGLEEACRQLLRRVRDKELFGIAKDRNAVESIAKGEMLGAFTDAYVDTIIDQASRYKDPVISSLANCIQKRRPPKLLKEVQILEEKGKAEHAGALFKNNCKHHLKALAKKSGIKLGRFLICETRPLTIEERGSSLTGEEARKLKPDERQEIIKVFVTGKEEPVSVVDVKHSMTHLCSNHFYQVFRLYLVPDGTNNLKLVKRLRRQVAKWH
jgi:HD superfamily phosphohydrolase